jgi:hypothetical protein
MLTSTDLIQALRPAFVVYALAMASTGAALEFASDGARQAARTPVALRWLEDGASADARARRPVASVARGARVLGAELREHAVICAGVAAEAPLSKAAAGCGAVVADALADLR